MNAVIWGRIGKDAELEQTSEGTPVAKFSLALRVYKKGSSDVQWVYVSFYGQRAETLLQYLTTGLSVTVAGDLKQRSYDSRDEGRKTVLDMNAASVELLGAGSSEQNAKPATKARAVADSDIPF